MFTPLIAVTLFTSAACGLASAAETVEKSNLRWYRGNTHTHSLWSDGNDFPDMIADWYRSHGYHFLALSDHNILSAGDRWFAQDEIVKRGHPEALEKYRQRFGDDWVETQAPRRVPQAPRRAGKISHDSG